jgi:hypothetical protein
MVEGPPQGSPDPSLHPGDGDQAMAKEDKEVLGNKATTLPETNPSAPVAPMVAPESSPTQAQPEPVATQVFPAASPVLGDVGQGTANQEQVAAPVPRSSSSEPEAKSLASSDAGKVEKKPTEALPASKVQPSRSRKRGAEPSQGKPPDSKTKKKKGKGSKNSKSSLEASEEHQLQSKLTEIVP